PVLHTGRSISRTSTQISSMLPRPPSTPVFPYTTLFRSAARRQPHSLPRPREHRRALDVHHDVAIEQERRGVAAQSDGGAPLGAHQLDVGLAGEFLHLPAFRNTEIGRASCRERA